MKNLSVEKLAKLAGVSHSAITKAENGKSIPDGPTLEKLVRVLDATMGYFYGEFPNLEPRRAAVLMAYDVFVEDTNYTAQQRERCRPATAHSDAPLTAQKWCSFCEQVDLVLGPPGTSGQLELVPPISRK